MVEVLRRLHLLVEGQTEEAIVNDVLAPYLTKRGFSVSASILVTRRPAGQPWNRGGATSWARIAGDVRRLLGDTSLDVLTTLIDYYGFPADAPGMASRPGASPFERVTDVESAVADTIGDRRFVPHLVLHETEAWVFAAAEQFAELRGDPALATAMRAEVNRAGGAELINEGARTAPSRRLVRICPDYVEIFDGPLAIADLDVAPLRQQCPHMDSWLRRLGV